MARLPVAPRSAAVPVAQGASSSSLAAGSATQGFSARSVSSRRGAAAPSGRSRDLWSPLLAVMLVVAAFLVPSVALARSYDIDRVTIDATLDPDASLAVVEDRLFEFDGSFNGVYWKLPKGELEGRSIEPWIDSVGVVDSGGDLQTFYQSESGSPGTYELTEYSDYVQVKLYWPSDDEDVTFRIAYTLPYLASAWSDTGELYWKFVSDGWDETSRNVTCTVHLPVPAGQTVEPEKNVRAWGHGTLDATVAFNGDDVVYKVPAVGSDDFAEARITFPVDWLTVTPDSRSRMNAILAEEQRWADEANRQRAIARTIYFGTAGLVAVVGGASIAVPLAVRSSYRRKHRPVFTDPYFRDVPSDDHPAVLGALLNDGDATDEGFTATLMHTSDAGAIDLNLVQVPKKGVLGRDHEDYQLVKNPSRAERLVDPVDRALLACLFDDVAPLVKGYEPSADGRVALEFAQIKKVAKKHPEEFVEAYHRWESKVEAACTARGFFTAEKTGAGWCWLCFVLCVLVTILGGFMLIAFEAPLPMFLVLLLPAAGIVVSAMTATKLKALSSEAVELKAKLEALRAWLKDFTRLDEAVPTDVVLWNRLLVMAVVLGVADEVIEQLRVSVPQVVSDPAFLPTYVWWSAHGSMGAPAAAFGDMAASSYKASTAAVAASSSSSGGGGGGGFSGGGGGGFGGGGGGGAF